MSGANGSTRISVRDYDPITDGSELTTGAVQDAIDDCAARGGGEVYVSPGEYLVGTIVLRDGVTLNVRSGATLRCSEDVDDLGRDDEGVGNHVVAARDASDVGLVGSGRVDGSGASFWEPGDHYGFGDLPSRDPEDAYSSFHPDSFGYPPQLEYAANDRGNTIQFDRCTDVRIEGVTIENPAAWTLNLLGCDRVAVRGVTIRSAIHGPNADGINLASCRNVRVSDCDVATGDDAIVLKNFETDLEGLPRACRNVAVSNCLLATTCNAFKVGTETRDDFENVALSNLTISGLGAHPEYDVPPRYEGADGPISGIAIEMVDGASLENVTVSNVTMRGARAPIFVRLGDRSGRDEESGAGPGTLRNVTLSNVVATGASITSSITGLPDARVENVTLSDVRISTRGGRHRVLDRSDHPGDTGDHAPIERPIDRDVAFSDVPELESVYPEANMWGPLPAHGVFCRHVDGLDLHGVRVECDRPDDRPVLVCDDVADLSIRDARTDADVGEEPMIELRNVREAMIQGVRTPTDRAVGLAVTGSESERLTITANDLGEAAEPIVVDESVPAGVVASFANRTSDT